MRAVLVTAGLSLALAATTLEACGGALAVEGGENWLVATGLLPKLRRLHDDFLAAMAELHPRHCNYRIGDRVPVNRRRYRIIGYLGAGEQGDVYLVATRNGRRAVKCLRYPSAVERVRETASLAEQRGERVVETLDTDAIRGILLLEYVEGLPLKYLSRPRIREQLTRRELQLLDEGLATRVQPYDLADANRVLSLSDGGIVVIDPM